MKNKIFLTFEKDITRLVGEDYGNSTYLNQVKDNIKFDSMNIIVIPEHIQDVSISFTKGLIKDLLNTIYIDEFGDLFDFEGNPKICEKMKKSVHL